MKRHIFADLQQWQCRPGRKPLILMGVRQSGKTFSLQHFGKNCFPKMHYVNFEKEDLTSIFADDLNPNRIISDISFHLNSSIDVNKDLVIFDEIQACPRALTSLKYFCEDMPQLALCSAGSLLGVQLNPESFPVGKVDMLHLRPMTFSEFLLALGEQQSYDFLRKCDINTKISQTIHQHLWQKLLWYFVIGGLPEVVKEFAHNKQDLFTAFNGARELQKKLIHAYYADITKHSGKANAMHIERVWQAVPAQLMKVQDDSSSKFKFKGIVSGIDRYSRLANVIDWLIAAELVIKIPIVNSGQQPLSAYTQESKFKLFMFDVGILGAMSDLHPKVILDYDYGTYKGYFAENHVAQEFIATKLGKIYSWQEQRSEVEFLRQINGEIIPIEVKSGSVTKIQSLQKYSEKYHPPYRIIISAKNMHLDVENKLHNYPLYLSEFLPFKW